MITSITPTIGRIVLFNFKRENGSMDCVPAQVVRVLNSDGMINIIAFGDEANVGFAAKCFYTQPLFDPGCATAGLDSWCEWMPYQKGQASLTESIAKKAGINA